MMRYAATSQKGLAFTSGGAAQSAGKSGAGKHLFREF